MNKTMPRTPFSTPLSGSAKETELRLKNIFSGPKKRPPVLFLALVFAACIFCGNLVSCQMSEAEPPDTSSPGPGELSIPADAGSGEVLQLLLTGGTATPTPELQAAFTSYFSDHPYELRSLPQFSPDRAPDWDELTFYIAVMESFQKNSMVTGLSAETFQTFVRRYFGDLEYTDRSSSFLTYEDGLYTYTGWDTNGATFYRLTGFDRQGAVYTASFDGVEIWDTDLLAEDDPIFQNTQAVLDSMDAPTSDWSALEERTIALLLEEDYARTFTVSEQVQITFRLSGDVHAPLVYLSCDRRRLDQTAPLPSGEGPLWEAVKQAGQVQPGEGTFYWALAGVDGQISAFWKLGEFSPQTLFTLDYSGVLGANAPEYPPSDPPVLDAVPFEDVLGQQGVLFSYDKGGRSVQHFWYLDRLGNPAPLALCDPGWRTGDLDGDGNDELWSISADGHHFYLYTLLPAEGRPRFAFVCGGGTSFNALFWDLERVEQEGDTFILCLSNGERRPMDGEELMGRLTEAGCWTYTIPEWFDGGRVSELDNI